jgi:hypothetical protein
LVAHVEKCKLFQAVKINRATENRGLHRNEMKTERLQRETPCLADIIRRSLAGRIAIVHRGSRPTFSTSDTFLQGCDAKVQRDKVLLSLFQEIFILIRIIQTKVLDPTCNCGGFSL